MGKRNTFHKSHMPEFKAWMDESLIQYRDGKGDFQVLQVMTANNGWQCIYDRIDAPEHYTVQEKLMPTVIAFLRSRKSDGKEQLRTQLAAAQAEINEQARLNGMGAEREARLLAKLAAAQAREAKLREALENCRLYAARHRKEEWATHILRFCEEAGITGSITR